MTKISPHEDFALCSAAQIEGDLAQAHRDAYLVSDMTVAHECGAMAGQKLHQVSTLRIQSWRNKVRLEVEAQL